jgi:hypothetical protein
MIGFLAREGKMEKAIRKSFAAILFGAIMFVLLAPWLAYGDFYAYCYWVTSGTKRTVAWVAEPGATGYELQIRRMENGRTIYQVRVAGTQKEITWKTPGHYVAYVRWYKLVNNNAQFGEWANSLQEGSSLVLVGGEWIPRAWIIIVPTTN